MGAFEIQTMEANGLEFAYYSVGEGPLVLFCHGFPDTADTWSQLLPSVAALGYRAVAPFMRGYAPTDIPSDGSYSSLDLGRDVLAWIEALGEEKAILVGHDWGASAVYTATAMAPQKVHKMVTLAIPHPRVIKPSLGGIWRARHFITFQFRGPALRKLKRDNFAFLEEIYRRWSPKWELPKGELDAVRRCFCQPGVAEAALGYYWSFRGDQSGERGKHVRRLIATQIPVPSFTFVGDADGALDPALMEGSERAYSGSYGYKILPGVGHFLHREDPEMFQKELLAFLGPAEELEGGS